MNSNTTLTTKPAVKSKPLPWGALVPFLFVFGCGTGSDGSNPRNPFGEGPAGVSLAAPGESEGSGDLGSADSYVLIAQTGISNQTGSVVTGNVAVTPAASSYITGFGLIGDPASNDSSTSSSVIGNIYSATHTVPTPSNLTTASGSVITAYNDAAGRTPPDESELASGDLGGLTLAPNLYKWGTSVTIPTDVTFSGGANDVWILQIAGNVTMASAKQIILAGGAQAKNIYWQVAGQVTLGTDSHFEGIILAKTAITLQTNATMNGRAFAQSRINLDDNEITQPD